MIVEDLAFNDSISFDILEDYDRCEYRLELQHVGIGNPASDNKTDEKVISDIAHNALIIEFTSKNQKQAAAGHIIRKVIHVNSRTGNIETTDLPPSDHGFGAAMIASIEEYVPGVVRIEAITIRRNTPDAATTQLPQSQDLLASLQGWCKCEVFNASGESIFRPDAITMLNIEGAVASFRYTQASLDSAKVVDDDDPEAAESEQQVWAVWLLDLVGSELPQQINLIADPNGEKSQLYGIIECTEDRLRIRVAWEDQAIALSRPTIFAPGSKVLYVEARRQTPGADPIPQPKVPESTP